MDTSIDSKIRNLVHALDGDGDGVLHSAMVYGSLARGEYQPERSDVNLLLAFERCSPEVLERIRPQLLKAWRANRVRPFLLTASEVPQVADVFPLKLWDIQVAHQVVHGADVVSSIDVDREHLRLRVEQELRNELIRLRWQHVHRAGERETMRYIRQLVHRARTVFSGMLHLCGETPSKGTFAEVFAAMPRIGLDSEALALLQDRSAAWTKVQGAAFVVLEEAIHIVDGLGDE